MSKPKKPTKENLERQVKSLRRRLSAVEDTAREFFSTIRAIGVVLNKSLDESVLDAANRLRLEADEAINDRSVREAKIRIALRALPDQSTEDAAIKFAEWAEGMLPYLERYIRNANQVANEYELP
jgi:DNA-binding winged helix-turn-helix (wHTH) protein